MKQSMRLNVIEKIYLGILLIVFGGIVLHAPLTVVLGTIFPDEILLIKSWKEILMLVASLCALIILRRRKQTAILREPLMVGIAIYAGLHIVLAAIFAETIKLNSLLAGLMIDLRYLLFFVLVYIAVRLYPSYRRTFISAGAIGAAVVVTFAVLQVFVLPADVLKYIGYNVNNIAPYLTVDKNPDFIRINSTLRGPNPLGAYAAIVLTLLIAFWVRGNHKLLRRPLRLVTLLGVGSLVALWASYSRSALVAAIVSAGIVVAVVLVRKVGRRLWITGAVILLALLGGLFAIRDTTFVSNVVLHVNPVGGSAVTSNDGHISSLQDGIGRLITEPLGEGVGSTGSASLLGDSPLVIENQYLFIAHEVGWFGLILFVMIVVGVIARLWQLRRDWLALGVMASGIGLLLINLLLPVWVDDTVSIIWWGLAAIAIGSRGRYE